MTARSRTGATVNCLVSCQLVVMGGEQRVITTLQDITARKHSHAELRESRENSLGLFNTVSEAIQVYDSRGIYLDVNGGATTMYGCAKEELVGKTLADVSAPRPRGSGRRRISVSPTTSTMCSPRLSCHATTSRTRRLHPRIGS